MSYRSIVAIASIAVLLVSSGDALARPKDPIRYSCSCGCLYQDKDGKNQWGSEVTFNSSSACLGWSQKGWNCSDGQGNSVHGKLAACFTVKETGTGAAFQPGDVVDGDGQKFSQPDNGTFNGGLQTAPN